MSPYIIGGLGAIGLGCFAWMVQDAIRYSRRPVMGPVKSQAVDCAGDSFDYAAFIRGWDEYMAENDAPNVVEDWELQEDGEVAALDQWFGLPVLPGTPIVVQALAQL